MNNTEIIQQARLEAAKKLEDSRADGSQIPSKQYNYIAPSEVQRATRVLSFHCKGALGELLAAVGEISEEEVGEFRELVTELEEKVNKYREDIERITLQRDALVFAYDVLEYEYTKLKGEQK